MQNNSKKFWTGVGSRETPDEICLLMERIAFKLSKEYYILRSGGADGADAAFKVGATNYFSKVQPDIYIPWEGFNSCKGEPYKALNKMDLGIQATAKSFIEKIHPAWEKLSRGAKALHTRNVFQVLGDDLKSPSKFLICWAKVDFKGVPKGGTRTAWVLATENNVPCYNLYFEKDYKRLEEWVSGKRN